MPDNLSATDDRSFILELLVVTEDGMSREDANELGVKLAVWLDRRKGVANTIFSEVRGADD